MVKNTDLICKYCLFLLNYNKNFDLMANRKIIGGDYA